MMVLVTIIHVLACIVLVLVVLLQAGKGADMGAVFGGASSTIFGSSGAGNFLTRLTTGAAVVFMITSLTLTYGSSRTTTATIMPENAAPAGEAGPAEEQAADAAAGAPAAASDDTGTADQGSTAPAPAGEAAGGGASAEAPAAP